MELKYESIINNCNSKNMLMDKKDKKMKFVMSITQNVCTGLEVKE